MPTNLGALPSTKQLPGAVQIKRGAVDNSLNVTNASPAYGSVLQDGAGGLMQIQYTPDYPCMWQIRSNVMYVGNPGNSGGIWQRVDYRIWLSPADLDAKQLGYQCCNQVYDAGTVSWRTTAATCMYRLAAGVTYTCSLQHAFSSGFNQLYHTGPLWMRLMGRIIGEGSI